MFWKIYFVILIILLVFAHAYTGIPRAWEVIGLVFDALGIVGLVGFCWERKILVRYFWMVFMPIFVIWFFLYGYVIPEVHVVYTAPVPSWFDTFDKLFSWAINLLWFIALFLYAFIKSELWD